MTTRWISLVLGLVFFFCFVVRVDTHVLGPTSTAEMDDLAIESAYFDSRADMLLLLTSRGWTSISLDKVVQTNRQFEYDIKPRDENSIHWTEIDHKQPSQEELAKMEKVAVLTNKYASFNYYHSPPDGKARKDSDSVVTIPDGYKMALYRGEAEVMPDNKTFLKSYVLVSSGMQQDGRCGFQFFYNPDQGSSISFQFPNQNILFLPSFLALCIALPLAFSEFRAGASTALFVAAFILHGFTLFGALLIASFRQSWGADDGNDSTQIIVFITMALAFLVVVKVLRSENRFPGGAPNTRRRR